MPMPVAVLPSAPVLLAIVPPEPAVPVPVTVRPPLVPVPLSTMPVFEPPLEVVCWNVAAGEGHRVRGRRVEDLRGVAEGGRAAGVAGQGDAAARVVGVGERAAERY